MKYRAENTDLIYFVITKDSELVSAQTENNALILGISDCAAQKDAPGNETGKKCMIPLLRLRLEEYRIKSAYLRGITALNVRDNTIRHGKDRQLYKSETESLVKKLCAGGDMDIFSLNTVISDKNGSIELHAEINTEDGERAWYGIEFSCTKLTAEWEAFGETITEKLTLRQRAALIKENIPAVFLALGHKDTPATAKTAAGLALAYALSPIDLIPDFIPVLGYLDDVLILSGLIAIAVKLIPSDVLRECRIKAAKESIRPKKRWYYSLPIIIIWLIIMALIVKAVI